MEDESNRSFDFTNNAWEALYDAVDNDYFRDKDSDLIYSVLKKKLRYISFGEYLKRYLYQKSGLTDSFESVPLKTYQDIIKESFFDNSTPHAFEQTTAKLSALSKNWLTQQTVNRRVVFLLGFGLGMSVGDVNDFLTKALREQGINAKSPFEVICWYCYKNKYGYLKYEKLWQEYQETPPNPFSLQSLHFDLTVGARNAAKMIDSDLDLMTFVSKLKTSGNATQLSVTAKKTFDDLYKTARELVAELFNEEEEEQHRKDVAEYQAMLLNNDRISDIERQLRVNQRREERKLYTADEISEADLEHIISSAIPIDRHGNLTPSKASKLNAQFSGKRFSRQHISDILAGKTEVTRFDIITLNFFIYSQTLDDYPNSKIRYISFIESTNRVLDRCFLGKLYISNPYECFVLMCLLSDDPLGTYADVWEMSFEKPD